ncbi:MAG: GNAT family N-acetyltransferase [Rhodoferax sp.]|nr:GNAT family N-acetyltransferase [Rhodoferax sp.]
MSLSAPHLLTAEADVGGFGCGTPSLDEWLKRRAMANQVSGASRTYVVTDRSEGDHRVVGYYCLASGALAVVDAPGTVRRNMPDPVPMAILGRLAVDGAWAAKGLGVALLQDAVLRTTQAADILGIRGLLAHAVSAQAKAFYEYHGFKASPTQPMTLVLSIRRN